MFTSGLELDMTDFRKNSWRSLVFGLYTFSVPLVFGILAGRYLLGFGLYSLDPAGGGCSPRKR